MEKKQEKTEKILKEGLEAIDIIALLHSYRQSIAFEKKSIKELKKYVSPDEMERIKKHLKNAEKILNELTNDLLDAVFKNMKCLKDKGISKNPPSPLKIRIGDSAIYGFPTKLSKHLNKNDWSPFYEHLNKATLQVVKNQIKGHEKNGDKKYLPFEIMIVAQYQISGDLDQNPYPFVKMSFFKD